MCSFVLCSAPFALLDWNLLFAIVLTPPPAQVLGIDVLGGCKVRTRRRVFFCAARRARARPRARPRLTPAPAPAPQEVEKQFALVERHIARLRTLPMLRDSDVVVMCERNLGFESEHLQRALSGIPNVRHRIDHKAQRYGIIMNEEVKYGAQTPGSACGHSGGADSRTHTDTHTQVPVRS